MQMSPQNWTALIVNSAAYNVQQNPGSQEGVLDTGSTCVKLLEQHSAQPASWWAVGHCFDKLSC